MELARRLGTAGSVFMIALAIGFVMQNADMLAERFGWGPEMTGLAQAGPQLPAEPASVHLAPPATQTYELHLPEA